MYCRGQLAVLVVVALMACACAAPGANYTQPTNEKLNESDSRPVRERFPHAMLLGDGCGGTIISPNWILTAVQCAMPMGGSNVWAYITNESDSLVMSSAKRSVIHPLFTIGPYWLSPVAVTYNTKQLSARWDFLLVELEEPLPLNGKTLAAAKLDDQPSLPAGLQVSHAEYGASYYEGYLGNLMHAMELTVQSNQVCSTLEQFSSEDMLCAKGRPPTYDYARGRDAGNGLVDETGRLVGVTSWFQNNVMGYKDGDLVVFARVSSVRDWIKQITGI